jgi:transcriptional regulator with XRE-family HTH domain
MDISQANIGLRAKALRKQRGMTLMQLADLTQLSKGHLSRFERGDKTLSLAALMRLASALDTVVGALLGETPFENDIRLTRAGTGTAQTPEDDGGYSYVLLSGLESGPAHRNTFLVNLPKMKFRSNVGLHSGTEIIFVIRGTIELSVGKERMQLAEGDYVEFPGHYSHEIRSVAGDSQILITVLKET